MYFSQVGNGILLPFILIFMLSLVNNRQIMGEFTNTRRLNVITVITIAIVIMITLSMVIFTLLECFR
jgi:Mn2+/Fe2+ NRAMP family transporter